MTDQEHNPLMYHEEVVVVEQHFESEDKYVSADDQGRLGFVRKVYGIVFTQLAFTVAFVCVCMKFMGVQE